MSQTKPKKYPSKRKKQKNQWLPLIFVLGGGLLILAAFLGLRGKSTPSADIEVTGAPSLKADKESVDLGDVKLGETVEVSFQLTNVGDQTLRFSEEPYVEVVEGC